MERFLVGFLLVNSIFTVVYVIGKLVRKEGAGAAVFFLFLPGLGFAVYFLPLFLGRLWGEEKYDRESLTRRDSIGRMEEHPDVEEELNVVPVEDAMAVNENREKRALLLRQLRKDIGENYRPLLAAEQDEDSESVHYVAAARMEVHRRLDQEWLACSKAYEEDRGDAEKWQAASGALRKLIESQVLSGREQEMYRKKYCALAERQAQEDEGLLSDEDYGSWLEYLIETGQIRKAEGLWEEKRERLRSEACYMNMARMYYGRREKDRFDACVAALRKDRRVRLSAQGLETLRYWIRRG